MKESKKCIISVLQVCAILSTEYQAAGPSPMLLLSGLRLDWFHGAGIGRVGVRFGL